MLALLLSNSATESFVKNFTTIKVSIPVQLIENFRKKIPSISIFGSDIKYEFFDNDDSINSQFKLIYIYIDSLNKIEVGIVILIVKLFFDKAIIHEKCETYKPVEIL